MTPTKRLPVASALLLLELSVHGCGDDHTGASTDAAMTTGTASTQTGNAGDWPEGTTDSTSDTDGSMSGPDASTGGDPAFNTFALHLGGNDGEVALGPVSQVMGPTFDAITVAAWLRRNDATAVSQGVLTMGDGTFADTVFLLWSSERNEPEIAFYAGGVGIRAAVADPTQWVHVVATYDALASGQQVRLYLDGTLAATGEATLSHMSSGDFFVGRFGRTGLWLEGAIDELALWSVALEAEEVASLSSSVIDLTTSSGDYQSTASLVAWWRMGDSEGGMGKTVEDEIGSAHGQLLGDAAFDSDVPP